MTANAPTFYRLANTINFGAAPEGALPFVNAGHAPFRGLVLSPAAVIEAGRIHGMWRRNEEGGQRADLAYADLTGTRPNAAGFDAVDLTDAYVLGAYLGGGFHSSDLNSAIVSGHIGITREEYDAASSTFGALHDYATGAYVRPATADERAASDAAPEWEHGAFAAADGVTYYVQA